MSQPLQWTLGICAAGLTIMLCCVCWETMRQEQAIGDAAAALTAQLNAKDSPFAKLGATLDALIAPCKDFQGDYVCGPIPQLAQTEKNLGIVAAKAAQQVQQTGALIQASTANLNRAGDSVTELTAHLSKTADAATDLTQGLTADTRTLDSTLSATQPILASLSRDSDDLDALLKDGAIHQTLNNLQGMTASSNSILADAHVWSHPFLNPEPCLNFRCRLKRYVWPVVQTSLGLGGDLNQIRILAGHPLPVSVGP